MVRNRFRPAGTPRCEIMRAISAANGRPRVVRLRHPIGFPCERSRLDPVLLCRCDTPRDDRRTTSLRRFEESTCSLGGGGPLRNHPVGHWFRRSGVSSADYSRGHDPKAANHTTTRASRANDRLTSRGGLCDHSNLVVRQPVKAVHEIVDLAIRGGDLALNHRFRVFGLGLRELLK